ncbi:MAG: PAS domain S-box protein [Candidatus Cloacimonetes bacterium]|nr:PAS domain S-box protein [Candidatus Cloacimonadota bacterium]
MKHRYLFVMIIVIIIGLTVPLWCRTTGKKLSRKGYNVLLLHSYNSTYIWSEKVTAGLQEYLEDNSEIKVNLYPEYLDAKRYPGDDFMEKMYMIIEEKYRDISNFNVIVASDNQALTFMMRYGESIFPDVPVVFCGINYLEHFDLSAYPNYTGVVEMIRPDLTIEHIRNLQPEVKKLYLVSDCNTKTGIAAIQQTRKLITGHEQELEIFYPVNISMNELEEKLADLTDEYAALLLIFNIDRDGNFFDVEEAAELITQASSVPVYACWDFYLKKGVIGGAMTSGYDQGSIAGRYVLDILGGAHPEELAITWDSPVRNIFDMEIIEKFDLKPSRLKGTLEYINNRQNYFQENWRWLLIFLLIITAMAYYIFILLSTQRNLEASRQDLHKKDVEWARLADSLPGLVFRISLEGRFTYINSNFYDLLLKSPEEIIGRKINELNLGERITRINESALERAIASREAQKVEFSYKAGDKQYAFETNIQPEFDEKGELISLLGIVYDLSERYRSEMKLKESEKKATEARKIAHLGYWELDLVKNRMMWSTEISEILGIAHEPENQSLKVLVNSLGADQEEVKSVIRQRVRTGELHFDITHKVENVKNISKWISERGEIITDSNNEAIYIYGTVQDITSEKIAEQQIRSSEAKFRAIFNNAPMGISLIDKELNFIYFNPSLVTMSGYKNTELEKKKITEIVSETDRAEIKENYERLFQGISNSFSMRKRLVTKAGFTLWTLTTVTSLNSEEDDEPYALTMEIDINERVLAEQLVAESQQLLKEAQKIARFGYWRYEPWSNEVISSDEMMRILGYDEWLDNRLRLEEFISYFSVRDRQVFRKRLEDCLDKRVTSELAVELKSRRQESLQANIRMVTQETNDSPLLVLGTFIDITLMKSIESRLRQSEARFRLFFENSPLGVIILDAKERVNLVNPATEKLFNMNRSRMRNMAVIHLFHEGESEKFYADLKSIKEGEQSLTEEYLLRRSARDLFWCSITMASLSRESENEQGIILLIEDINEQKIAREKLRESEEKYRSVFEVSQDGLFLTNLDKDRILEVNTAGGEMFGYNKKGMIGQNILELFEDKEKLQEMISKRMPLIIGKKGVRSDGNTFPMEISLNYYRRNHTNYHVASIRNISERFKFEEELQKSEKKFRTIIENAPLGVIFVDREGRNLFNNELVKKMFKIEGDIHLSALETFISSENQDSYRFIIDEIFQGNRLQYFDEQSLIRKDGTEFYARIMISVVRTDTNNPDFAIFMIQDITQQREAEQKVHLYEKLQSIGQLAGMIAHDFNNQLMGILGYSTMLQETLEDETLRNYAGMIYTSAERSAALTQQLLSFARKGKQVSVNMNCHKLIQESISLMQTTTQAKITSQILLKAPQKIISGDPGQIQNALLNLLLNACDAMPNGGELTISTMNRELTAEDTVRFYDEVIPGRYLEIVIADTGHGMDEQVRKHLFEPFFTTKREGKGTGLGLPAVFGTVKSHLGYMSFTSEVDQGTAFYLYFPLAEVQVESPSHKRLTKKTVHGQGTIMVVDDEEIVRNTVKDLLASIGYKVIIFENGETALEYYQENWKEIDLILLDVIMPGMEGPEVYQELRKINSKVKVLLFSAFSSSKEVQNTLDDGALGFVRKPVLRYELSQKISQAMADQLENSTQKLFGLKEKEPLELNLDLLAVMQEHLISQFDSIYEHLKQAIDLKDTHRKKVMFAALELFIQKLELKEAELILKSLKINQEAESEEIFKLLAQLREAIMPYGNGNDEES